MTNQTQSIQYLLNWAICLSMNYRQRTNIIFAKQSHFSLAQSVTRKSKQSVRQAKLVQSSRFQSCPVKGSLQAGI
jgi:hypothetical protein